MLTCNSWSNNAKPQSGAWWTIPEMEATTGHPPLSASRKSTKCRNASTSGPATLEPYILPHHRCRSAIDSGTARPLEMALLSNLWTSESLAMQVMWRILGKYYGRFCLASARPLTSQFSSKRNMCWEAAQQNGFTTGHHIGRSRRVRHIV